MSWLGGDLAGALGQRGRREVVGGAVLEVAGEVDRLADDAPGLDRAGDVVVGGDDQLGDAVALVIVVVAFDFHIVKS